MRGDTPVALVRGAYAGWDAPVYFSEENTDPSRSIPRALFLGLILTAVLYVGVNVALLAALGVAGTARSVLPFTTVLMRFGGSLPSILFAFGAMMTDCRCLNQPQKSPSSPVPRAASGLRPRSGSWRKDGA